MGFDAEISETTISFFWDLFKRSRIDPPCGLHVFKEEEKATVLLEAFLYTNPSFWRGLLNVPHVSTSSTARPIKTPVIIFTSYVPRKHS